MGHIHGHGVASCESLTTSETASLHASVNGAFFSGCTLEGSWVITTWLCVSMSSLLQISMTLVVQLQPDANMHGVDHKGARSLWRCLSLIHTKYATLPDSLHGVDPSECLPITISRDARQFAMPAIRFPSRRTGPSPVTSDDYAFPNCDQLGSGLLWSSSSSSLSEGVPCRLSHGRRQVPSCSLPRRHRYPHRSHRNWHLGLRN